MNYAFFKIKNQFGFTLIEVIISIAILVILALGIFSLILLSLRVTADNKYYVEAIGIANQKMEQIRNLPYSEVGVQGGIPSGNIPQVETISREGTFTINTYVTYYDDPYDGSAGVDTIINDYKIATIKVGWVGKFGDRNVTIFSKIIPRTEETAEGYGLLKILVNNAGAEPLAGANVRVVNNSLNPAVDVTNPTDASGILYLPALESFQSYEITVTKTNEEPSVYYGADQSYLLSAGKSPIHLSVTEGDKTEESFTIDKLANLQIRTVSNNLPDNWRVNLPQSARDQINANFSLDSFNNMYFVWQSNTATSSYIYAQKYNSSSVKQWANDYKISNTAFQRNPDIAAAANGNLFVVWQDDSITLKQIAYDVPDNFGKKYAVDIINSKTLLSKNSKKSIFSLIKHKTSNIIKNITAYYANTRINANLRIADKFEELKTGVKKIYNKFSVAFASLFHDKLTVNNARAAGSIVQTKIGSIVSWSNTLTATFDNQPTEGNVIIAIAVHGNNNSSFNLPTNTAGSFTESAYSDSSWYLDIGIWHKIIGAGEPSQVTLTNSGNIEGGVLMIMEVSGLDTSNLIDVTSTNDETGSDGLTASTGSTAQSEITGFGVAAIAFADNNFTTPSSSNWASGSSDNWTHQLWQDWGGWWINDGSLAVATLNITSAAVQSADLTLSTGGAEQRNSALAVFRVQIPNDATVGTINTQTASIMILSTSQYTGGAFVITDNTGTHNVTGITISENGTVDAQNNLSNIKLYYDLDIVAPYNCADEQYDAGIDAQFGSAASFNGADGSVAFTDNIEISTTKTLCIYTVLDVLSGAGKDETVEIKINDPSTDITLNAGTALPDTTVEISGATILLKPTELNQIHYRWRDDDGSEISASWKDSQDTPTTVEINSITRLRFEISNEGSIDSGTTEYRIEYGEMSSSCSGISSWTALPNDSSQHWQISDSANLTDSEATTNVSGLTDENTSFKAGQVKDAGNQTSAITLTSNEFTELEYAIQATSNINETNYCFRLTNAGSTDDFYYTVYPEISVIGDENIYIVSLDASGSELWSVKKVNSDSTNTNQTNPKIAITQNSATTTIVWQDERNGNTDIYAQALDILGNKLWGSDLQITSSSTNEHSPAILFDSNNNIVVAWVNDGAADKEIYLQKFDLTGANVWLSPKNISNSSFDDYSPSLTVDSSDNIYLSWTEDILGVLNVRLAKFDSNGISQWETQANISSLADNQYDSAVAINNSISLAYVLWTDDRDGNEDIYAQKYDLNGNAQWTNDLKININLTVSAQSNSVLAINTADEPFAAWQDNRDTDYNIYATKFTDPGSPSGYGYVPIRVYGTKTISETPVIYEFDHDQYTDASGYANLSLEWDAGYTIELVAASTSLDMIYTDPIQPLEILPDETKEWTVYVE